MEKKLRTDILVAVSAVMFWIAAGTVTFHFLEKWSWTSSFYFAVTTLTTVGFGDFVPTTDLSRLLTSIYILLGVGMVLASLGIIASDKLQKRKNIISFIRGKKK